MQEYVDIARQEHAERVGESYSVPNILLAGLLTIIGLLTNMVLVRAELSEIQSAVEKLLNRVEGIRAKSDDIHMGS